MLKYAISSIPYLGLCYFRTRIFHQPARLIRFPFDLRGRHGVRWGARFTTGRNCRIESINNDAGNPSIVIGDNVQLNDNVHIVGAESVTIGNDVLIASKVFISDCSHGSYAGRECSSPDTSPASRPLARSPVVIGDRVWLGDNVVIMPGVHIGSGSVIGASAVVVSDIPAECIAVGVPARVVKVFDRAVNEWVAPGKANT